MRRVLPFFVIAVAVFAAYALLLVLVDVVLPRLPAEPFGIAVVAAVALYAVAVLGLAVTQPLQIRAMAPFRAIDRMGDLGRLGGEFPCSCRFRNVLGGPGASRDTSRLSVYEEGLVLQVRGFTATPGTRGRFGYKRSEVEVDLHPRPGFFDRPGTHLRVHCGRIDLEISALDKELLADTLVRFRYTILH
jgi:hypothetical protein